MNDVYSECEICKIIENSDYEKFYFDEDVVAFEGNHPDTPVHIIIAPRKHISSIDSLEQGDEILMGKMIWVASLLASQFRIAGKGYKLIFNVGKEAGQEYPHIVLHMFGGKDFTKKPHI